MSLPAKFAIDDSMFIFPAYGRQEVRRDPNIKALPLKKGTGILFQKSCKLSQSKGGIR